MKKSLRILVVLSIAASSILFVPSATAVIGTLYSSSTGNGDVACGTTGWFTISSNAVASQSGCVGSVQIPSGVTTVNEYALSNTTSITSVSIPASVTLVSNFAFANQTNLVSLTIASGLSLTLNYGAFFGLTSLTSLTIPSSVTSFGTYVFYGASSLTSLTIPSSVTAISAGAFSGLASLTSLTIPSSVTSIGAGAFGAAYSLTTLTIPSSVTFIDEAAFYGATSLKSLTIPSSVTAIGDFAFQNATSLTSLTIPSSVTSIGNFAFSGATSLTSLTIPSSVTSIGYYAFNQATSLTSLTIPSSVTSLGPLAFGGATSLSSYQYCGTVLTSAQFSTAGLGSKTKTCPSSVTAPGSPTSVVATATGKRTATVSFAAPASNGGSAVTSYTATSTPGGLTQTLTQATGGTFNFDGLQPSTAYSFAVTAKNAIGTSSAATSNSVTTTPLEVATLSALSFVDDGTGTAGKIVWAGTNIDSVLYRGPELFYPGPFKFGAFTSGWNGRIRNLIPNTTYDISIVAFSADGVGGEKSLTFTTNAAPPSTRTVFDNVTGMSVTTPLAALTEEEKLAQLLKWVEENTYLTGEASNMSGRLTSFAALETSPNSSTIRVPLSSVSNVVATSLTPNSCSVVSATAEVDAGIITALTTDKCTISYTVTGGSNAPATIVRDFVFTYFELKCGAGTYKLKAGFVSSGESCTGAVTIDSTATSIAYAAFVGSLITSITLPNSITKIPDYAFAEASKLTKVELGNAITSIRTGAFRSTGNVSISLPSSLRTLDNYVFLGSAITSLIIPEGTTTVGLSLFQSSRVFTTVTIPSTITYMHPNALIYSGAKTVYYCGNNASVLKAIFEISRPLRVSATCVAPAIKP